MMFVTPSYFLEGHYSQGGQGPIDFVSRSMGGQQRTIIAPRRRTDKHGRALFHYMDSNRFPHSFFHWWEVQFSSFDESLALPTSWVSGPNKTNFSVQHQPLATASQRWTHCVPSGRLRNPAIESHESRWKWLQQGRKPMQLMMMWSPFLKHTHMKF